MSSLIRRNNPVQTLEAGFAQALSIFEANSETVNTDESLKPEYVLLRKVANGELDPYKFFPYRGGKIYETRQRWSEYFTKFYKEAFHEQAMNTLKRGGLTDTFILQNMSKKLVPLPFPKGEGGLFFLRTLANSLYPHLTITVDGPKKETKYDWLEPAKVWHKRWFEGFFKDPAVSKVKVDVLFEFVSENLPFRVYKNSLREYIKARGAMSHEEFLALEEQEQIDSAYSYDFAFLIHNMRTLKPAIDKKVAVEKKRLADDKESIARIDEIVEGYTTRLTEFGLALFDKVRTVKREPVIEAILDYVGLVLLELFKKTTSEENEPLLEKVLQTLRDEIGKYKENPSLVLNLLEDTKERFAHFYDLLTFKPNAPARLITVVSTSLPVSDNEVVEHMQKVASAKVKTPKPQPVVALIEEEQKEEEPMATTTPQPTPQVEVLAVPTVQVEQSYFVSNGIKLGLLDGSLGSITINKTFIVGKTLNPSDMSVHVKALDCLVLSRP